MPELSRDSHPAQPVDITMFSTVIAMPALSESEHGDRLKEASDPLHRKYCTNGSQHPYCPSPSPLPLAWRRPFFCNAYPRINPFDIPGLDAYHVPRFSWSSTTTSATARRPVRLSRSPDRPALSTLMLKAPLASMNHLPVPGTISVPHVCGVNRRPACLQGRTWPEPRTQAVEAQ